MTLLQYFRFNIIFYFNSHPHIEDDRAAKEELKTLQDFNSHPHIEDDSLNSEPRTNIHISIHILI